MVESKHTQATEVVASLEGMKVVTTGAHCELYEYNFEDNKWRQIDSRPWPVPRDQAEAWLKGWNSVDRFTALSRLIAAEA